jgi:ribose/xylose/arabinose/galactoside ABC-type transport system permease subunit
VAEETPAGRFVVDQRLILLAFLVVINVFFALMSPTFFALSNYFNVLRACAMIVITGTAATLLMMTSNFDLSAGSNIAFTSVVYALLAQNGLPLLPAALVAMAGGTAFGFINGGLVARFNIPPFIASLGMMYIGRGLAYVISDGTTIVTNLPPAIFGLAQSSPLGVPSLAWFMVLFVVVFLVLQKKTLLGKYALAIGGNPNAAFFSGINTRRIVFVLYVFVGALASFCGILTASRFGAGDPRSGMGFEFDVILAIMLGGTSLKGGKGSVIGTLLGALVVTILDNGLNMMNVLTFWQSIVKGIILVLAILSNEKLFARARVGSLPPAKV